MNVTRTLKVTAIAASLLAWQAASVFACHGPATAAGGVHVWSARQAVRGSLSLMWRVDYTGFQSLTPDEIQSMTEQVSADHQHLDVVDHSSLFTMSATWGVSNSLEISALVGYYGATRVGEGHAHAGSSYEFSDYGDVTGVADSWLSAKYRVHSSPSGDVAIIAGLKVPSGIDDVTFDGAPIDQALQPGSGSWDAMLAAAVARDLGDRFVVDASAQYVLRTEANDYRVGDQVDVGVALAARFAGDMHSTHRLWALAEINGRYQAENESSGVVHENSGGTAVFVSPGLRAEWSEHFDAVVGVQLPIGQKPNDVQQEVDFKVTASFAIVM